MSGARAAAPAQAGVAALLRGYRDGSLSPAEVVAAAYERAQQVGCPAWISLTAWPDVRARLQAIEARRDLPLWGVPFAVKDNIDVAGVPTTAGCPAFAYTPDRDATVVARLQAAGAIAIGKTNMDQFATGLTGTRTPYGACASVVEPTLISGGSSSGSAVVVADGTVPFALGTDTAGSGRVPAAMNSITGLKPSRGLLSTAGCVPACRSLDCVSLFTRDAADARRVLAVAAGHDDADPFSRRAAHAAPLAGPPRLALPLPGQVDVAGDPATAEAWGAAQRHAASLGWQVVGADVEPFLQAARMLYDGPFVAERYAAVGAFVAANRDAVDPTVAEIILGGAAHGAADLFAAQHRLAELRAAADATWRSADALLLPTVAALFTHAEIAEEPVARNAVLGTYTNFANLLDCAAVAVPGPAREDGLPFGVTLFAPAGCDEHLLDLAAHWTGG